MTQLLQTNDAFRPALPFYGTTWCSSLPFELGLEYFELSCQLPVKRA